MVLLIFLLIFSNRQECMSAEKPQKRIFVILLWATELLLLADILGRLDGKPEFSLVCRAANYFLFAVGPALWVLWFLYICSRILPVPSTKKTLLTAQFLLCLANFIFVTVMAPFGKIYYFDSAFVYHRGPLFLLPTILMTAMAFISEVLVAVNFNNIDRLEFISLICSPIVPACCGFLQVAFYSLPILLSGLAFSLVIIFINIQDRNMNIDYLTGVYNRRSLDVRMRQEIRGSTQKRTFSAILIDIDDFKGINDRFGHNIGDKALEDAAFILRKSLRADDLVTRYGGDEFCIILDVSSEKKLKEIIQRIRINVKSFNETGKRSYRLAFSMGYAVYEAGSGLTMEEFQKKIDQLMYKDKRVNHRMKQMKNT
jgi:diguanylate cyclase (GGDEF)-like protein